jgi:hypothetical protein
VAAAACSPLPVVSKLNYRCGGSAGFANGSLTGFPFQPLHVAARRSPSTRQGYATSEAFVNRHLGACGFADLQGSCGNSSIALYELPSL